MPTVVRNTLLSLAFIGSALVLPESASAATVLAHVVSIEIQGRDDYRQVLIRVDGETTCGTTKPLRWRATDAGLSYEDGMTLLTSALLSRAGVVFDVTNTGTQCRINKFVVAQP